MAQRRYPAAIEAFSNCREAFRTIHQLTASDRTRADRMRDDEIRELRDALSQTQTGTFKSVDALTVQRIQERIRTLDRDRQRDAAAPFVPPAEVSLALGSAYFRSGDRASAEREWRAAVEADRKLGEAWNNLAVIALQTGRLDEAEDYVKRAERARFKVHPGLKDDIRAAKRQ